MPTTRSIPDAVGGAVEAWLGHHDRLAPGLLTGVYLVGSVALDDWRVSSDIDIVAFADAPPGQDDVVALRAAHRATIDEIGRIKIDGPRLTWNDVALRPAPVARPWTLDGEFHHDSDCFEINPATWYTLANYGIAVRGPSPDELTVHLDPVELASFVRANTDTYWRSLAAEVTTAADDPQRTTFHPEMTTWCVLGVARMLYTAATGDVASKSAAGEWLASRLPEHAGLVEHALTIRRSGLTEPDDRATARATAEYLHHVVDLITTRSEPAVND